MKADPSPADSASERVPLTETTKTNEGTVMSITPVHPAFRGCHNKQESEAQLLTMDTGRRSYLWGLTGIRDVMKETGTGMPGFTLKESQMRLEKEIARVEAEIRATEIMYSEQTRAWLKALVWIVATVGILLVGGWFISNAGTWNPGLHAGPADVITGSVSMWETV